MDIHQHNLQYRSIINQCNRSATRQLSSRLFRRHYCLRRIRFLKTLFTAPKVLLSPAARLRPSLRISPSNLRLPTRGPRPQSVPAMTFSRPTIFPSAPAGRRWLRMFDDIRCMADHAGHQHLGSGNFTSSQTRHSCSWRGLAASMEIVLAFTFKIRSMMSRSGMSYFCGP